MYEQIDRTYTEDHWRSTTYRRKDGSQFNVALPPIEVQANYGDGQVFLDHRTYNERAEHEGALRLAGTGGDKTRGKWLDRRIVARCIHDIDFDERCGSCEYDAYVLFGNR